MKSIFRNLLVSSILFLGGGQLFLMPSLLSREG